MTIFDDDFAQVMAAAIAKFSRENSSLDRTFRELVEEIIELSIENPECKSIHICNIFGLSRSKFHKRLEAEGTCFREIKDIARINRAIMYLSDQQSFHTLEYIAGKLGFVTRSALYTWFRRRTGLTPDEWRNAKVPINFRSARRSVKYEAHREYKFPGAAGFQQNEICSD